MADTSTLSAFQLGSTCEAEAVKAEMEHQEHKAAVVSRVCCFKNKLITMTPVNHTGRP